jgi:hypothetical protein
VFRAVYDKLRVDKETVSLLRAEIVIALPAVTHHTAKPPASLLAVCAFYNLTTLDCLTETAEFIAIVKKYLRCPQGAKLMNV